MDIFKIFVNFEFQCNVKYVCILNSRAQLHRIGYIWFWFSAGEGLQNSGNSDTSKNGSCLVSHGVVSMVAMVAMVKGCLDGRLEKPQPSSAQMGAKKSVANTHSGSNHFIAVWKYYSCQESV